MTNRKLVAAFLSLAITSVFFWAGCGNELTVNAPIRYEPIFEPYISTQPASYIFDAAAYTVPPELEVIIDEWDSLDGTLTFQWYTFNTIQAYLDGTKTAITDATGSSYTPPAADITPTAGKTYYYYVVVTNTNPDATGDRKVASTTSDIAAITFYANDPTNPVMPVITQNPANAVYTMGRQAAIAPLEVRATVPTGGTLAYQWYKITKVNNAFPPGSFNTDGTPNGTAIDNAIDRTYLPDITELRPGDAYYYVVVSNVTKAADGTITASSIGKISVPAVITMELGEKAAAPRITAQPKDILYFQNEDISGAAVGAFK